LTDVALVEIYAVAGEELQEFLERNKNVNSAKKRSTKRPEPKGRELQLHLSGA
jgi:hypothetical protein